MRTARPALAGAMLVVGALALSGCGATLASSSPRSAVPAPHRVFSAPADQALTITIHPIESSKLKQIDWRTGSAGPGPDERVVPSNIAVEPWVPVHVTIVNLTRKQHTFTSLELGVSVFVPAATDAGPSRTTFTFTAQRQGEFRWFCALPCGGYMGGTVYALGI